MFGDDLLKKAIDRYPFSIGVVMALILCFPIIIWIFIMIFS